MIMIVFLKMLIYISEQLINDLKVPYFLSLRFSFQRDNTWFYGL